MLPLTLDDLLPLEEYAGKRREYFDSHLRYLDRYRRVRVGPQATLLFENRQTLWFRVQEVVRIARLTDPRAIQQELNLLNRLLPAPGHLQAALVLETKDEAESAHQMAMWAKLSDEHIRICLGKDAFAGCVLTCRPEDRCMGAAHWIQFKFSSSRRQQLADLRHAVLLEIALPDYQHRSPPLSDEIRQSLIDDLNMSDTASTAA